MNHLSHRSLRFFASASLVAIATSPAQASAQELWEEGFVDDQEIIVTGEKEGYVAISSAGLKTATPLVDTPQTVSVVTREQLGGRTPPPISSSTVSATTSSISGRSIISSGSRSTKAPMR